jgi:hypothetical protein
LEILAIGFTEILESLSAVFLYVFVMLPALKEGGKHYEITRPKADLYISVEKI